MSSTHKDDPRWREAQSRYTADYPHLTPAEALVVRQRAAREMYDVEREYVR